jgi:hypothetical protein
LWPRVARRPKGEGLTKLGELVAFCNRRGASWWRSIPRIGSGRARAIVSWLRRQQAPLGLFVDADVDSAEKEGVPLIAPELVEVMPARDSHQPAQQGQDSAPPRSASDQKVTESGLAVCKLTLAPLEVQCNAPFATARIAFSFPRFSTECDKERHTGNGEHSLRNQIHGWVVDRGTGRWLLARVGRTQFTEADPFALLVRVRPNRSPCFSFDRRTAHGAFTRPCPPCHALNMPGHRPSSAAYCRA